MMDIREMKAGRELDALIQVKFFEAKYMCHADGCLEEKCCMDTGDIHDCEIAENLEDEGSGKDNCPEWKMIDAEPYSTNISAAWEVVEKMREVGYFIRLADQGEFIRGRFYNPDYLPVEKPSWVEAETVPEAICKVALIAMEVI